MCWTCDAGPRRPSLAALPNLNDGTSRRRALAARSCRSLCRPALRRFRSCRLCPCRLRLCRSFAGPAVDQPCIELLVHRHDPLLAVALDHGRPGGGRASRSRRLASVRMASAHAAMPSRSAGSRRKPVSPSVMTSGRPPTRVATTGTPQAIASSAARPKLSSPTAAGTASAPGPARALVAARRGSARGRHAAARAPPRDAAALGAVADQQQQRAAALRARDARMSTHGVEALDRTEVGGVQQQASCGRRPAARRSAGRARRSGRGRRSWGSPRSAP